MKQNKITPEQWVGMGVVAIFIAIIIAAMIISSTVAKWILSILGGCIFLTIAVAIAKKGRFGDMPNPKSSKRK